MPSAYPIPQELKVAFDHALSAFDNWSYGAPAPVVTIDRDAYTIETISDFVMNFRDSAPKATYDHVVELAKAFRSGRQASTDEFADPKDHTYQEIGQCLFKLCSARRDYFRQAVHSGI
jgi:hypothetical protein